MLEKGELNCALKDSGVQFVTLLGESVMPRLSASSLDMLQKVS